jgi:hypothetical protein
MGPRDRQLLAALAATLAACGSSGQFQPDVSVDVHDTIGDAPVDTATDSTGDGPLDVPPDCADSDGDGVCDEIDVCPGFDDSEDEDADTVPDGCDVCPGGDDRIDSDGDTLPDMCDCEGVTCDENATCYNTEEGPTCVCDDGYEGDGFSCTDIDECALGTDTCDAHATCTNTPGSYTCTCNTGYSGDGRTCTDINECSTGAHSCHMYATCTNTDGGYTCTCNSGYDGDGFTCTPVNHCTAGTDLCDTNAVCVYTGPGTYTCTCNPGYSGDGFTCTPIDHCTAGTHTCDPHATCTYTGPGTYTCTCNAGYTGDGFTCTPTSTGRTGTARRVDGTWIPIQYVTCGTGAPGTCTDAVAKSSCTSIGKQVVSHASDGTSEVYSLGGTVSCMWDVSYLTIDTTMPSTSCLVGISNLEWSGCCGTTRWHGNTIAFGAAGAIFGYVYSGDSGYVSTYPNVTGAQWGCVAEGTAASNRTGCTTQYVVCTR